MIGRPLKPTLYVLPHGIEVVSEYQARGVNCYARLRIRPHPFFPDAAVQYGGVLIRRSRAVLASKLGRALTRAEHAHHDDEDRDNDVAGNLMPLSPAEHNRHHKTGTRHTESVKTRIAESLRLAYASGRHSRTKKRDLQGRIAP